MLALYESLDQRDDFPRLPLDGALDLTYRCNNHCRHCWLWVSPDALKPQDELSLDEIKAIVGDARRLGCRRWAISGGEPMLRPDFPEIFDLLTSRAVSYSLNTNGTLITPKIAQLLKRKGNKMVALYGATAEVHDHITRTPGSFEAAMRGFHYLNEAGAGFTVQLVPMRDNYHQFVQMKELALSLSKHYRVGASWLNFSAYRDSQVNQEIMAQRLLPSEAVALDKPDISFVEKQEQLLSSGCSLEQDDFLFAACIGRRKSFHVDPYGGMSFCATVKIPSMRYDLRQGSFQHAWDKFIPSLARIIPVTDHYRQQCGSCVLRVDCRGCRAHAYLEHGDCQGKVDYLCAMALESKKYKENWMNHHRHYFQIAGITIQVDSDIPLPMDLFMEPVRKFKVPAPGEDVVSLCHHFGLPDLQGVDLGREVYRRSPWAIYRQKDAWTYLGISPDSEDSSLTRVAVFNHDHSKAEIYNTLESISPSQKGLKGSLAFFPTDQVLIARLLADRQGFYLHSCGVDWGGRGYLFAGHSGAGKSTMAQMLAGRVELLCDDRMIVRKNNGIFKIYGTWHHGTEPQVSPGSAPLKGIFFINQSLRNEVHLIKDKKEIMHRLLPVVIRPFVTVDWWEKTLAILEEMSQGVPCYELYCDKSGNIVKVLEGL